MRELRYHPDIRLSLDEVYNLALAQSEDEEQAQQAATQYAWSLLKQDETLY